MNTIEVFTASYEFHRARTLGLLERIEQEADPQHVLAWRPGRQRAHIGWQLTHIGITEEIFASERLAPHKAGQWTELWPRFRGGSTPDDDVPTAAAIREVLAAARQRLLDTLGEYDESRLDEIPAAMAQRQLTIRQILGLIGWHEAHHQGQAHLTYNLYRAAQAR